MQVEVGKERGGGQGKGMIVVRRARKPEKHGANDEGVCNLATSHWAMRHTAL